MNYRVKHTMVGPYPQGRVVSGEELTSAGIGIARLVELEAIEPTEDPESADPLPPGPENRGGEKSSKEAEGETVDLNEMTKSQLMEYAEQAGVEITSRMTKEEMIEAIQAAQPTDEAGERTEPEEE